MTLNADTVCGTSSAAPGFSWNRVKAVAEYYYPMLRAQMIIYPIVAFALYIVATAATHITWTDLFWAAPATVISFMVYLAPVVLTRRDSRMVDMLLPATALEKLIVLGGYFFIIVPLLTYGVYYLIGGLFDMLLPITTVIEKLRMVRHNMGVTAFIYHTTEAVPAVTAFWTLLVVKRSRTLKVVLASVLSMMAMGIVGMVWGMFVAFTSGFFDGLDEIASDPSIKAGSLTPEQMQEITEPLVADMLPFMTWIGIVSVIYVAFALWMSYRTLKTRQI